MNFWDVLGILFVLFSAALLVPRVHIKADYSKDRREVDLVWRWLSLRMDFNENLFSGNVLFHKFPRKKKSDVDIKKSPQTKYKPPLQDISQPIPPEPESDIEPERIKSDLAEEFSISEPAVEDDVVDPKPDIEPDKKDYSTYDSPYITPKKKKKFKIPHIKFGRNVKQADPAAKETSEDKWFWLKYAWHERSLGIELLKGVFRSMGRFIHRIRTDYCNIDLSLGTGDPMTTAHAAGSLESTLWLLRKHGRVEIAPLYEEERFDFEVSCSFSMRPYQAVGVFAVYLITLPWGRMVRVGWNVKGRVFGK